MTHFSSPAPKAPASSRRGLYLGLGVAAALLAGIAFDTTIVTIGSESDVRAQVFSPDDYGQQEFPRIAEFVKGKAVDAATLAPAVLQDKAAAARYIDLYTGDPQPDDATGALAEAIAPHLPITVALLGMGNDMHTASLFPGADHLEAALASDAPPVMAIRAEGAEEPRITLTRTVLADAINIHLLIMGPEKREALERAIAAQQQRAREAGSDREVACRWPRPEFKDWNDWLLGKEKTR